MVLIVAIKNSEMGYFKAIITLADKKKSHHHSICRSYSYAFISGTT